MEAIDLRILWITIGLIYFVEGKACPERTRPHKTRCEMYYKCMELPTHRHVWAPAQCEKGLVYEHNLRMCVLPGDDWECTLEENVTKRSSSNISNKDTDLYIVTDADDILKNQEKLDNEEIEVVLKTVSGSSEEAAGKDDPNLYESSGDGSDLMDGGFIEISNREATDDLIEKIDNIDKEMPAGSMNNDLSKPNIDPKLTAHLQRLSQLIDGLKQKYQNGIEEQGELGPDQLNAFLAHFNIKNKFDSLDTDVMHGNYSNSTKKEGLYETLTNKTKIFNSTGNKLKPETKVVLTNVYPKRYGTSSSGYSNSQIVVNRPEGSVLVSLPPSSPYSSETHFVEHTLSGYQNNMPKISEETLKTVLELSKQMIANQNVPKVIPNPTYYAQPIIQPLFLPSAAFGAYNSNYDGNGVTSYEASSFGNHIKPQYGQQQSHRPQNSYSSKPGTTIIHNNLIPVHMTGSNGGTDKDNYVQSLGLFPSSDNSNGNSNNNNNDSKNGYTFQITHQYENNKFVTTVRPLISSTAANHAGSNGQYPSPYSGEGSVTTVRPPLQYPPSPSTIAEYYTPSPHLNNNNVNSIFQQPERYPTLQYGNMPYSFNSNRPSNNNAYQQVERPSSSYQSSNANALFPNPQIDANKVEIYPNSQKFESMETEDDLNLNLNLNGYGNGNLNSIDKRPPRVTSQQYGQSIYQDEPSPISSGNSQNNNKNPFMPRPSLGINKSKFPPNYHDPSQLVNIGGNFISYDVFHNTILPLIGTGTSNYDLSNNIEVISCQAGVRQPNITDCTRYYVCSKKDGKVLSYSCPPYTAFNEQTRICDARTYANCAPNALLSSYTISENKRMQMEAMQLLNDAKRRHDQVLKTQNLANLLQQYNSQVSSQIPSPSSSLIFGNSQLNVAGETDNKDVLNTYAQQAAALSAASAAATPTTERPIKKRKYYCKEGDKVPDQTSIYNYFVCYKNAQGTMKGHKMTCSKGLVFCPMTKMCTLSSKCS